jgi:hypothetical protein
MSAEATSTAVPTLYELFSRIEDPRDPRGVRHPLAALLTLAATAMLAGARNLTDIAEFGLHRKKLRKAIGFTRGKSPCLGTFHYLFKALDAQTLEAALQQWLCAHHASALKDATLHIDGKTLRGSRKGAIPGVHLVAAYSDTLGTALTQLPVDAKTNEHKAALRLLKLVPLQGTLVSGDAAFAQRDFSQEVIDGGGDYLLTVKENQPGLKQALLDAFAAPLSPCGDSDARGEPAHCHDA